MTVSPSVGRTARDAVAGARSAPDGYRRQALVGDLLAASVASLLALLARFGTEPPGVNLGYALAVPGAWVLAVASRRGYEPRCLGTGPDEYRRLVDACLLLFAAVAVVSYAAKHGLSRGYTMVAVPLVLLLTFAVRHGLRRRIHRLRRLGTGLKRVLVVGRRDAAAALIATLDDEPQHGLLPVGACVPGEDQERHRDGDAARYVRGVPVVGDPGTILASVDGTRADVVAVVSDPDMSGHALRRLSWALEERDVELIVSPGIVEVAGPRLSIRPIAGLSLLHVERPAGTRGRMLLKQAFDRTAGGVLLVALLPLLVAIAAAVRLTSHGPALLRQPRVGTDGGTFTMLRFRSTEVGSAAQPRLTTVGGWLRRLSLDELPQLVNVVRGDMSLVGPRPRLPSEVARYSGDAARRLRVRPGVTGLWQVSGRGDLSGEESLRLDLWYADNWSFTLDLQILRRTVRAVIRGDGAF
jgi:exopolysaccharide biosynthesis polyprenyl glycosylphosphotransferase